jgi:uncharacterized membrane protein YhdT
MLRYCATAAGLGAGWFVALLIPGMTRGWLLADTWQNLACLVVASVLVAVSCRRFIGRAESFSDHLVRAAVMPYLGCLVFLTLWAALLWARTLVFGGLANLHDTLSLYVMGLMAVTLACFVVVPYGLFCQYVMNPLANSSGTGLRSS